MDVRFCARQEPLPRGIDCTLRVLQSPFWALSRAPQKDPCFLLTKTYMEVGIPSFWREHGLGVIQPGETKGFVTPAELPLVIRGPSSPYLRVADKPPGTGPNGSSMSALSYWQQLTLQAAEDRRTYPTCCRYGCGFSRRLCAQEQSRDDWIPEATPLLSDLDDDLAFCTSCLDVSQSFARRFEWKDPIHNRTDSTGIDERRDLA